jgi:DNA replication protein
MAERFGGFIVETDPSVAVPHAFFVDLLPHIAEPAEIHVSLTMFRLVSDAGGFDAPIAHAALVRDRYLRAALRVPGNPNEPDRRIENGIDLSVGRGTLLRFLAEYEGGERVWYYVNTPATQALVAAMARGALAPPASVHDGDDVPRIRPERPNIFRRYEQNIGLLTPLVADQIVDAMEHYPQDWIEDAIAEAVSYNRRNWRYIRRILDSWAAEGRGEDDRGRFAGAGSGPWGGSGRQGRR